MVLEEFFLGNGALLKELRLHSGVLCSFSQHGTYHERYFYNALFIWQRCSMRRLSTPPGPVESEPSLASTSGRCLALHASARQAPAAAGRVITGTIARRLCRVSSLGNRT